MADTVVDKVKLVIETLARCGPLGLSALARESRLSKTTAHRIAGELLEWGVLDRVDGRFVLGHRMAELGHLVPASESLREVGHPFAVELFMQFRAPVTISVLHGLDVRCVAKVSATADLATGWMGVGTRQPAHSTAAGKAILAFSSREVIDAVVSRPLRSVTPFTIKAPHKLAIQLREVRRLGYAVVRQEAHVGASSIGVPIIDRRGVVAGALAMPLPVRSDELREVERALKGQAARLSARLSPAA